MTEIERKALALVNEVLADWGLMKNAVEIPKNTDAFACALVRAIEHYENYKQRVSDAVEAFMPGTKDQTAYLNYGAHFARFIIPKPVDPLLGVVEEAIAGTSEKSAEQLREALAARGFEIREKG